jgi:hypothetical protein
MKPWLRNALIGLGLLALASWVTVWAVARSWRADFDEEVRRLEREGAPVEPAQLAPPPVPDGENAALLIVEAARLLDALKDEDKPDLWDSLPDEEGQDPEGVKPYLEKCRGALEKLDEGLRRPRCRFPVDYAAGIEAELPGITSLVRFARLLNARAVFSLRAGDSAAAAKDLKSLLRLSEGVSQEPMLVSQLIRYAVVDWAFDLLKRDRLVLPEPEWKDLAAAFEAPSFGDAFARAYLMERAVAIDACRKYFLSGQLPGGGKRSAEMGWLAGVVGARSGTRYLREIGRAIGLVRKPYAEARAAEIELENTIARSRSVADVVSLVFLPAISRAHRNEASAEARCRMAAAFCRIKAGGRVPDSLELADPCTGKPTLYKRLDAGFELRSPGPNQTDDGGKEDDIVLKAGRK